MTASRGGPKTLDDCLTLARASAGRAAIDPDGATRDAILAHDRVCSIAADIRYEMHGTPEAARAIEVAYAVGELLHATKSAAEYARRKGKRPASASIAFGNALHRTVLGPIDNRRIDR